MKSCKSILAGEWFDGLSRGDDTYFMLTSKTTGNALPVVFILSGFSAHASMGRGAGSDWTADRPAVHPPVNTSHRRQGVDDLALQSCTARCFSSRVSVDFTGLLATFSCRHRFVHLSFRNKGAFAKTKLWAFSAAFAFGGRTVEFALQTSGTACGFCLPGLRTPFRTRPGRAVCMSDVWAQWTGR